MGHLKLDHISDTQLTMITLSIAKSRADLNSKTKFKSGQNQLKNNHLASLSKSVTHSIP
jgi:hypothetical protein